MSPSQLRALVARNIRQQAKRRTVTLNALADFAGVSRSQLYDVLAKRKAPSLDWIAKIAKALAVEPWKLLQPAPA